MPELRFLDDTTTSVVTERQEPEVVEEATLDCGCLAAESQVCNRCNSSCEDCCTRHTDCRSCGERVVNRDIRDCCNYCGSCCGCESNYNERLVEFRDRRLQFFTTDSRFENNPIRRHAGVEIEIERAEGYRGLSKFTSALDKWKVAVVEDCSLDGDTGFELNTQPANGDLLVEMINEIGHGLTAIDAEVESSCGLHVHIETKDFKMIELRRLIKLYVKTERALFELCDESRENGSYSLICGQMYDTNVTKPTLFSRVLLAKIYRNSDDDIISPKGHRRNLRDNMKDKYGCTDRYRALNLHSHFLRGTVEFRHHHGTASGSEIRNWTLVLLNLVESAKRMTEAEIEALPNNPRAALNAVVPSALHSWMGATFRDSDDYVWERIDARRAKQITLEAVVVAETEQHERNEREIRRRSTKASKGRFDTCAA